MAARLTDMKIETRKLTEIKPYPNNPRKNDQAVEAVSESIRQCGYVAPIIVDEDGVILAGHTRYKALKRLSYTEAEVVVKEGLIFVRSIQVETIKKKVTGERLS